MRAGTDIDQLSTDAHELSSVLRAAFEHVAHAELSPNLSHIDRLALVGHGYASRDDEGVANARQIGREAVGDRVCEMIFRVATAEIDERQHHEREAPAAEHAGGQN